MKSEKYQHVLSSHMNPYLSGVAKFNRILANHLGTPVLGFNDFPKITQGPVLLSVKLNDCYPEEIVAARKVVSYLTEKSITYDLFLHTFDNLELEKEFVSSARAIWAGNLEIEAKLKDKSPGSYELKQAWCPSLLDQMFKDEKHDLEIFSFGMAHKIQPAKHRRLHQILNEMKIDFEVQVSTAFHEKANFGDFDNIGREMKEIYGPRLKFLGFLSDEAVNMFLSRSNLFVAFFEKGVRANNTSFLAAMERGCAVLTNVDEYSPKWLEHGKNFLDINRITASDLIADKLAELGKNAERDCLRYGSWKALVGKMGPNELL